MPSEATEAEYGAALSRLQEFDAKERETFAALKAERQEVNDAYKAAEAAREKELLDERRAQSEEAVDQIVEG